MPTEWLFEFHTMDNVSIIILLFGLADYLTLIGTLCIYVSTRHCKHLIYMTIVHFVRRSTAVCASVVTFLALDGGSPPPVTCDIGSWHPHVDSEHRWTWSPPEESVVRVEEGVFVLPGLEMASIYEITALLTTDVCLGSDDFASRLLLVDGWSKFTTMNMCLYIYFTGWILL